MGAYDEAGVELAPARVAELLAAGQVELIDVRRDDEWDGGRIAGARHVELADLTAQAETIAHDRPVIFVCRVGSRSAMATEAFRASGWDAYNLAGGVVAWEQAGLPLTTA